MKKGRDESNCELMPLEMLARLDHILKEQCMPLLKARKKKAIESLSMNNKSAVGILCVLVSFIFGLNVIFSLLLLFSFADVFLSDSRALFRYISRFEYIKREE
jgi:hypothetical protein